METLSNRQTDAADYSGDKKRIHPALFGSFLFGWLLFAVLTVFLLVILFVPGAGDSALLQFLGKLLPPDAMLYTT